MELHRGAQNLKTKAEANGWNVGVWRDPEESGWRVILVGVRWPALTVPNRVARQQRFSVSWIGKQKSGTYDDPGINGTRDEVTWSVHASLLWRRHHITVVKGYRLTREWKAGAKPWEQVQVTVPVHDPEADVTKTWTSPGYVPVSTPVTELKRLLALDDF